MRKRHPVKKQRDALILDMFYDHLAVNGWTSPRNFAKLLEQKPTPRFFVEFEQARRFVSKIIRGYKPEIKKNKVYYDLAELLVKHPKYQDDARYKYLLLEEIIEQPAPSFYMGAERIATAIYEEMRRNLRVKK